MATKWLGDAGTNIEQQSLAEYKETRSKGAATAAAELILIPALNQGEIFFRFFSLARRGGLYR